MAIEPQAIELHVNGHAVSVKATPADRLSNVLREHLGLTGTKVGCDAGDCGACTVLLDDEQVCACLIAVAQVRGRKVRTIEGLAELSHGRRLQQAFHAQGAAQCGICTPGMLMAAASLQDRVHSPGVPTQAEVLDAIGGVLCRCTGYRKIVAAVRSAYQVRDAADTEPAVSASSGGSTGGMGERLPDVDGMDKVTGVTRFGADVGHDHELMLRLVRSPHAHAAFEFGDCDDLHRQFPGLVRIITADDIPVNSFGVYPDLKDQPVLANGKARFRGEAVAALVADELTLRAITDDQLPIMWEPLPAILDTASAAAPDALPVNPLHRDNVLSTGRVYTGVMPGPGVDSDARFQAEGTFKTAYVEHAYIEPEAGYARPLTDGRIEVGVCTQTPHMDRDEVARVLAVPSHAVRIKPPACGGGFGGKLDQSLQPILAVAARLLNRPIRGVYSRTESMVSSTKRHPANMSARAVADADGRLVAYEFSGEFNTGAYASWGPTVAGRVPVHCMGPYKYKAVRADARALFTHGPPAGAFRGFGVPQAAIAHECLLDELALMCGLDPLEFRHKNALRVGDRTATGQVLNASAGLVDCLDALRPRWRELRADAEAFNASAQASQAPVRQGVGVACMWYGCGNTSMSNPSTMRLALSSNGQVIFYNGAQDIGQGSSTILTQIVATALGVPADAIVSVTNDTDRTPDAGKTSASRQTFVSGRAAQLAGEALRAQILTLANVGQSASIKLDGGNLRLFEAGVEHRVELAELAVIADDGAVLVGEGTFDPPTEPLDENGQGIPYATYGFAAQIAQLDVDLELGTVTLHRIVAAHDVGAAVNPTLVEGQIEGGIAQGIGLALMEEYIPGRTENLHDYLIPSAGDVPVIECLLIEAPEPLGPYGAKGIGEPALVPTAPAILNAIHHATGVRIREVPALPHRLCAALRSAAGVTQSQSITQTGDGEAGGH